MKLNKVIVVVKKQTDYLTDPFDKSSLRGFSDLQKQHDTALSSVQTALSTNQINFKMIARDELGDKVNADLIISVGGDGTLLTCSHHAGKIPVLGVKSTPDYSVGFFLRRRCENYRHSAGQNNKGQIPR